MVILLNLVKYVLWYDCRSAVERAQSSILSPLGHGPDKISVPPMVAKLQWCKFICYINIS